MDEMGSPYLLAHGLGVSHRVVFLGPRPDTSELLRAFDIQVLPSISEGFSNSLLEGLVYGARSGEAVIADAREDGHGPGEGRRRG